MDVKTKIAAIYGPLFVLEKPGGVLMCGGLLALLLTVAACRENIDQQKFEPLYRAGKALQVAVEQTGGVGAAESDLLTKFQTEVATLDGRTRGEREAAALTKYREAADAYQFLLRPRALDFEAVNGRMLLAGTNFEAAQRYGLPVADIQIDPTLGRYGWADSGDALKTLFDLAPRTLADADRLVNDT